MLVLQSLFDGTGFVLTTENQYIEPFHSPYSLYFESCSRLVTDLEHLHGNQRTL